MAEPLSSQTAQRIAELKEKQDQAQQAFNAINNDPKFQGLQGQSISLYQEYSKLSKESDAAFKAGNSALSKTLSDQALSALDQSTELRLEYNALFKQRNAYQGEADSYKSQIASFAETQTSPPPSSEEQTNKATNAGTEVAKVDSPVPPVVEPDLPPVAEYVVTLPVVVVRSAPEIEEIEDVQLPPSNPETNTIVTTDEVQARLIAAFETTPIRPNDTLTVSNDELRNLLRQDAENIIQQDQRDITTDGEIGEIEDIQIPPEQQVINIDPYVISTINAQTGEITTEESTTINPSSDPSVRPGTQIFDDGSSLYYDPNTGETITTDIDGKTSSSILIPTNDSKENNSFLSATSSLPTRNQQMAVASPKDWRFKISLSPSANYLYKDANPGILRPLQATNGVIYPYTPSITVNYVANYSTSELTHSNYKIYNYKNSSVETINIVGDFTVQDSAEANYVLAVIHFFKSVTKMFYGQDQNPIRGTPPPLVYLTGFGQYQFDMHPVVITNFTHTFPTDVDYVNAYPTNNSSAIGGQNMQPYMPQIAQFISPLDRLRTLGSKIRVGGTAPPPTFINSQNINEVTRVPSKINIQLTCLPIVTRNAVSNTFSLRKYASGELMRGSVNFGRTGGGMW